MRYVYPIAAVCLCITFLSSCSMTAEHLKTIEEVLAEQVKSGSMTSIQFDAIMASLVGVAAGDWEPVLMKILDGVLTLAAGYVGVRWWRGPITGRKGTAPV